MLDLTLRAEDNRDLVTATSSLLEKCLPDLVQLPAAYEDFGSDLFDPIAPSSLLQLCFEYASNRATALMTNNGSNGPLHVRLYEASSTVLRTTASHPASVAPDATLEDWCRAVAGDRLGLDMLGLLLIIAAQIQHIASATSSSPSRSSSFVKLYECGTICLQTCREISQIASDVQVWLAYHQLLLTMRLYGHSAPQVWRLLGDLGTDVTSAGLYKNSTMCLKSTPGFLSECRRNSFAACFTIDKILATVFERPPRLSFRFCDIEPDMKHAHNGLSSHQRSRCSTRQSTSKATTCQHNTNQSAFTWVWASYGASRLREEILEALFETETTDDGNIKLSQLLQSCEQHWLSLPEHVRYDAVDESNTERDTQENLVCAATYLFHLQNLVCILRQLQQGEGGQIFRRRLLETSTKILVVLNKIGTNTAPHLRPTCVNLFCIYGLSSAAALIKALRQASAESPVDRSQVVRSLTIFSINLEACCSPPDAVYGLCTEASRAISKALDRSM